MKETRDYILEHWDGDYEYRDWYAVDSYDPTTKKVHRLYVGDGETACRMAAERASGANLVDYMGEPAEPGEFGPALFYRATLIPSKSARDYFLGTLVDDMAAPTNELIPVAQAAEELGIARQSAYELVRRGVMPSEECDGIRVGRYSVALRLAAKSGR